MSEFDDLLQGERDRLHRQRVAQGRAGSDVRDRWRVIIPRITSWLQTSARGLESRNVPPVPVLRKEGLIRKSFEIVGYRWALVLLSIDEPGALFKTRPSCDGE